MPAAAAPESPEWRRWLGVAVIGFAAVFCVFYLRSTSGWWYEDDPLQFAAAAGIQDPLSIFIDPRILRNWGTGASLVPMQALSYWFDVHFFGVSPRAARVHDLVALLACAGLLYCVLLQFGVSAVAAAAAAAVWLCLPATIAVHEFTGTRHYVEGFAFSLAAVAVLHAVCRRPPNEAAVGKTVLFLVLAAAAMLSKEIWVTTLTVVAIPYSAWHRRYRLALATACLLLGYLAYRWALLSVGPRYPYSPPSAGAYLRYLGVLPYTLAAGPWGWAVYALVIAAAVRAIAKEPGPAWRSCLLLAGVFAAGLVATYPTAPAVLLTYETPGTWYRAVFITSTAVVLAAAFLVGRYASTVAQVLALCAVLVVVLPGTARTHAYWQGRLARSESEGKFYLAHPDRLVYSEEDAYWFLPGLDRLYGVLGSHHVSKLERRGEHARSMVRRFPTIWRQRDGRWLEDPETYAALRAENSGAP